MTQLFLDIVNMSISASWLVLAVLILRLVLKKAPKWVNVLLWGIVAVRLVCPFSIESALSLIPSAETFPEKVISGPSFEVQTGIAPVDNRINDYLGDRYFEGVTVPTNNGHNVMTILSVVWIIGILLLVAHTVVSYRRLNQEIDTAVLYRDNIFQCETVSTPFVLGILQPKIYLPYTMDGQNLHHVVAHEQAHIRRKDHWWKPLGFLLLTIHWFNPLMWVAYILLCRDIELACDEKVIAELGNEQRADYTQALVACAANRRMIAACPLAFGEVGVKDRVKSIMNYRKPSFWIIVTAVVVCVIVAVCFLTDPVSSSSTVLSGDYIIKEVPYAATVGDEISTEPPYQYRLSNDFCLYTKQSESEEWNTLGTLTPYELTNSELNEYMPVDSMRKAASVPKITDAYILKIEDENFYLVFQTQNGRTYLAYGWEDVGERGQAGSDDTRLRRLYLLERTSAMHVTSNPKEYTNFSGDLNLGLNAEIVEINYDNQILYVKDINKSAEVFGDRCAIDCRYAISRYNLLYVNYGDPNDVRTIDFSTFEVGDAIIIGMYESEKEKAFNGSAIAEQVQLGTQKFTDENLIKKISNDLDLPTGCSISYIGEYSDGSDALLWFAIDGNYPDQYVAVECEKRSSGKYKFIDTYSPMTYAQDIVHVVWKAEDIFLVNNRDCSQIVYMNEAREVIREIDVAEYGLPYVFRLSMPSNPGICMFVDADGEEIR